METIKAASWKATRNDWTEGAALHLAQAFEGDQRQLSALEHAVKTGAAWLFMVEESGLEVGFFALAMHGAECEVLAAFGKAKGKSITGEFLPMVEAAAKSAGAQGIGINTFRPGMMNKLNAAGYQALSVNFWKAL